jgi:anti-sigma factor RsiW
MCERAREWASLRLDGELSEFERVLLDAHLRRCAACAAYVGEIGAITATIRATALEPLPRPIALPLRRRIAWASRGLQAGAAAAAVAALTIGLGIQSSVSGSSPGSGAGRHASAISSGPSSENGDWLVRLPRLANLKAQFGAVRQGRLGIDT